MFRETVSYCIENKNDINNPVKEMMYKKEKKTNNSFNLMLSLSWKLLPLRFRNFHAKPYGHETTG